MLRLLLRILGLTALLAAATGAVGLIVQGDGWNVTAFLAGRAGQFNQIAAALLFVGALVAGSVLLTEILGSVQNSAGRRSALGGNVLVQVLLAAALLVGANLWSFRHYLRWDCTTAKIFTLKPELASQLKQLRGETTIVIYQQHKTFGRFSEKPPDRYDIAAERKVVEKVRDLVDQLREFGPQFRVVVLDVEEDDFDRKLAAEAGRFPGLAAAIDAAPENSIFFCDGQHVQRMGFNEYFQLDKTASREADRGRGNLVLLEQGVEPFVRRVLAIEERKPRVGVAVVHGLLSTRGSENDFSMAGLKKSLATNGFEVTDIILKRWAESLPEPEPAVYTFDENRLDWLEDQLAELNQTIPVMEQQRENYSKLIKKFKEASLEEISKMFKDDLRGRLLTDEERITNLARFESIVTFLNQDLTQAKDERSKYEDEMSRLTQLEGAVEGRRITDIKGKFRRFLDECDLLIIPRVTLISIMNGWMIRPQIHRLNEGQVEAIRDFMKAGKPVFVLLGPINEPNSGRLPPLAEVDNLEALFGELGLAFGKQTILFTAESKAFAERRTNPFGSGLAVEIPPLQFDTSLAQKAGDKPTQANPISHSMQITARSVGQKLDINPRHLRPVFYSSSRGRPPFIAEFAFTDGSTWNEEKPFPERNYTPRFEPPKNDDPNKGTRDEEQRGPFSVGLALETTVPPEWLNEKYRAMRAASLASSALNSALAVPTGLATESLIPTEMYATKDATYKPVPLRIAALGHGGVFNSADAQHPDLSPAKEQLLLTTCNWLLSRDDRLPRDTQVWRYPRLDINERDEKLWGWGAILGLPSIFAYFGLIVLLVRRRR